QLPRRGLRVEPACRGSSSRHELERVRPGGGLQVADHSDDLPQTRPPGDLESKSMTPACTRASFFSFRWWPPGKPGRLVVRHAASTSLWVRRSPAPASMAA